MIAGAYEVKTPGGRMTKLDTPQNAGALSQHDLAGVLDWWREAGVDCSFADDAEGWLEIPEEAAEPAPPPPKVDVPRRVTPLQRALDGAEKPAIGGARDNWPSDLAAFESFWLTEPSLAEGALSMRVPPRGTSGASLMVLIPQPEEEDRESLLSGRLGALVGSFLRAAGLDEGAVYFASALPRTLPLPDWAELAQRGLADLTRHHIGLVRPQRVLAFGRGLMPLLSQGDTPPPTLSLPGREIPLMIARRLDRLARMPGHRKHFWTQWLEWTA